MYKLKGKIGEYFKFTIKELPKEMQVAKCKYVYKMWNDSDKVYRGVTTMELLALIDILNKYKDNTEGIKSIPYIDFEVKAKIKGTKVYCKLFGRIMSDGDNQYYVTPYLNPLIRPMKPFNDLTQAMAELSRLIELATPEEKSKEVE